MEYIAKKICIVGGGAAGMMAAGTAALYGAEVTIFENTDRLGKKLAITGKGRCNVTNNSSIQEFLENVTKNPRFLYAALNAFDTYSTMALFEGLGVPLKTERGRRVFPVSDKAHDIVDALVRYSKEAKIVNEKVSSLIIEDGEVIGLRTNKAYYFDAVILATGGMSYPLTGSDGSGYSLAKQAGHTITPIIPSLVPLEADKTLCKRMQGLSLKNVAISIINKKTGTVVYTDFGEMLFTHFGVSGPMILSASSHIRDLPMRDLVLKIDLKPALDEAQLDTRLLSDFKKFANRDFSNALHELVPSKMIDVIVDLSGIDPTTKVNSITKAQRKNLLSILKGLEIELHSFRPIDEAIITSGGVETKEISPKTMMSKLASNLYFAGEIIDVDAYTGGYNLQIAFSTGFLAGTSASEY